VWAVSTSLGHLGSTASTRRFVPIWNINSALGAKPRLPFGLPFRPGRGLSSTNQESQSRCGLIATPWFSASPRLTWPWLSADRFLASSRIARLNIQKTLAGQCYCFLKDFCVSEPSKLIPVTSPTLQSLLLSPKAAPPHHVSLFHDSFILQQLAVGPSHSSLRRWRLLAGKCWPTAPVWHILTYGRPAQFLRQLTFPGPQRSGMYA